MLKNRLLISVFLILAFGVSVFAQDDFIYDAKGKRNPFIPLVTNEGRLIKLDKEEEKGSSDLVIDGIIYDKQGSSYAIINGQVVSVGDYAGEYRVLKVESDRVVFLKQDQIREVFITQEGLK
jgi:competence protein ComGC